MSNDDTIDAAPRQGADDYLRAVRDTLGTLGFSEGECFEVAAKTSAGFVSGLNTASAPAAEFAARHDGRNNCYIGLNPIKAGARPPNGRVRDSDIGSVRVLLIDVDPETAETDARAAATTLAVEVRGLLKDRLGVLPPLVSSGRGRQMWLLHMPIGTGDPRRDLRRRLVVGLSKKFDQPGVVKVDRAVHNVSRLGRLPGTVNLKTGERAQILDPGDGQIATLDAIEALVLELEAAPPESQEGPAETPPGDGPPGGDGSDGRANDGESVNPEAGAKLKAGLLAALEDILDDPAATTWVGALAAKEGVADAVRALVKLVDAFDAGVEANKRRDKLSRPFDEALAKRITRAIKALKRPARHAAEEGSDDAPANVQIVGLVRRTAGPGRGASFDLEVATIRGRRSIASISAADLRSYERVSERALGEGLVLPKIGNKQVSAKATWLNMLMGAMDKVRQEATVAGEDLAQVVEQRLLAILRDAPRDQEAAKVADGSVLVHEGRLLIDGPKLIEMVRSALADDLVTRACVVSAARRLGLEETAPTLSGAPRGIWSFPAALVTTNDEAGR